MIHSEPFLMPLAKAEQLAQSALCLAWSITKIAAARFLTSATRIGEILCAALRALDNGWQSAQIQAVPLIGQYGIQSLTSRAYGQTFPVPRRPSDEGFHLSSTRFPFNPSEIPSPIHRPVLT